MAGFGLSGLQRSAGRLALAYAIAVAGFCLWGAFYEAEVLLFSLILIPWFVLPVLAAAAGAGASPTSLGAMTYLLLEAALILFSIWATVDTRLHGNSTASIGLLFLPVFEWLVFGLVFLLALACGWRMRPDFLRERPDFTPQTRA